MEIALWIDTPALGDTIAAIPTLRKISEAYGNKPITVFTTKPFLFENHPLVKQAFKSDADKSDYMVYRTFSPLVGKQYEQHGTKIEFRYSNMDFRQFHAVSLGFTLQQHEMEMDLYIEKERELPVKDYVIIHPTHTWASRTWETEKWQELIDRLNSRGIPVVAVGRDSKEVGFFNTDKPVMDIDIKLGVNLLNDPDNDPAELRWMMNHRARAVVTMDSGMLHVAGTTDVNIIQLGSSIDNKLRAPYRGPEVSQDYKYFYVNGGCDVFCSSNMKSNVQVHGSIQGVPPQVRCLENRPTFECHPSVNQVFDSVINLYDVKPNIKLVHLLLNDDITTDRQTRSIDSLKGLADRGVEYVQVWNNRWTGDIPIETFSGKNKNNIGPGHYGNFRAFADAAKDHFTEDIDALIFCEGDALLTKSLQETVDAINYAYDECISNNIGYFSFGDRFHLERGSLQSTTLKQYDDIHIVNKVIGAQMVMIPSEYRRFVLDRFAQHPWTTADIFFNNIFTYKFDIGIFEHPIAIQADGLSIIDNFEKKHLNPIAKLSNIEYEFDRAIITHTTENYEDIAYNLAKSVSKYSKYPMVVYTIDYDASDRLKEIATCKRLDLNLPELSEEDFNTSGSIQYVNRSTYRTYMALSSKIEAMINATNSTVKEWLYLDGDCIANYNVDDLFEYVNDIEDYPLATVGPHEYPMLIEGGILRGNPFWKNDGSTDVTATLEYPLIGFLNIDSNKRSTKYRTTNILLGNSNCGNFLNHWKSIRDVLPTSVDLNQYAPFHEETIFNVLVWDRTDMALPMSYVNIVGSDVVLDFFKNEHTPGLQSEFYRIPGEKTQIKVFHGEKRESEVNIILDIIDSNFKKKLVYLAPHLSTGGMPEFLLKRIQALQEQNEFEVYVVEYCLYATTFTVQRDQIQELLGDRFYEIGHLGAIEQPEREARLIEIIESINPDVIHIEECPESFDSFNQMSYETQQSLYASHRPWKIVETCHNIWFNPKEGKRISPDAYAFVTPHHRLETFAQEPSNSQEILFPIIEHEVSDDLRRKSLEIFGFEADAEQYHLINIGLWTPGKNQGEAIQWARELEASQPGRFQFHFIGNQASNFAHYWEPLMQDLPANCHIHGERSDVETFYYMADAVVFNSTWECNPLTVRQSLGWPLPVMARNLSQYHDMYKDVLVEITGNLTEDTNRLIKALEAPKQKRNNEYTMARFKKEHLDLYLNTVKGPQKRKQNLDEFTITWDSGPKVTSKVGRELFVDFHIDGKSVYNHTLQGENHWCKPAIQYYADWQVYVDGKLVAETPSGLAQIVQFDSSSLGDTLSWVEPAVAFKNEKGLDKLYLATHKNWLFDQDYYRDQGIEFIAPGEWPEDAVALWRVGVYMEDVGGQVWFQDKNKRDWRKIYLGDIASDSLGIGQVMKSPKLIYSGRTTQKRPYICIATASTAQAKYWNNEHGWQGLIDHYKGKGYDVYHVSKEETHLRGLKKAPEDLKDVYRLLQGAELFFGISSGLSWFAWATDVPVVLISGFTPEICEFNDEKTLRIINKKVCNSCWFDKHFDRGDWNWCPEHKGSERMFECTKEITTQDVINAVETWQLNIKEETYEKVRQS